MIKKYNLRAIGAEICQRIIREKLTLATELKDLEQYKLEAKDLNLLQELTYGTIRYFTRIEGIYKHFLTKPLPKKADLINFVLAIGIYQILYTRIPSYAAINETVNALKSLKQTSLSGLVNAILHKVDQEKEHLDQLLKKETEIYAHPHWLIQAIKKDYPQKYKEILQANNEQAPFWIRINLNKISLDEYKKLLCSQGISIKSDNGISGICLEHFYNVEELPFFKEGYCYIQDLAAQRASLLLDPKPKEYILDACAAPGGKTTHILEICNNDVEILALDLKTKRLEKLKENLARTKGQITILQGSADRPEDWWDQRQFDRILIDAPCSGTGVIRRHPDIKFARDENALNELVKTQHNILEALWPLLKVGGTLLYATCSILKRENSTQINDFIYRHRNEAIIENKDHDLIQALPGENDQDGFFYAKIKKIAVDHKCT